MNPRKKTIIAFFAGTGYDFINDPDAGYVPQEALSTKKPQDPYSNMDPSFCTLNSLLEEKQERYGYDGCHQRGGGLFAYGVKEPAAHLYRKLKELIEEQENHKITLVLTAHSRGCLSALLLAKKLNADAQLKQKIDVILDFRDPVPGNFSWSAQLDVIGIATAARQLYDLRTCTNIKQTHITVQELGNLPIAYDVLVPRFSPETELDVDYLLGVHDIQERDASGVYRETDQNYFTGHYAAFLLGICQSLKLYALHGADFSYQKFFSTLFEIVETSGNKEIYRDQPMSSNNKQINSKLLELIKNLNTTPDEQHLSLENFIASLEHIEKLLYDTLLEDLRHAHPAQSAAHTNGKYVRTRQLHFGGKFQQLLPFNELTHLNQRHAILAYKHGDFGLNLKFKPLLGFRGKRADLSKLERVSKAITDLRQACQTFFTTTDTDNEIADSVSVLHAFVEQDPLSPACADREKIVFNFANYYQKKREILTASQNREVKKFCRAVDLILNAHLTIGFSTVSRASDAQHRGRFANFWSLKEKKISDLLSKTTKSIVPK